MQQPTDFNDLQVLTSLDVVRAQVLAKLTPALEAWKLPRTPSVVGARPENLPPPAPQGGGEPEEVTLETLKRRYALISGETKVFDTYSKVVIKKNAFELMVTKDLANQWLALKDKRVIASDAVKRIVDGSKLKKDADGLHPLARYVYLDGTQDVWDKKLRERIPAAAVRLALGDNYKYWVNSPNRRVLPARNIVFDPKMKVDPEEYINTFEGLPLEPLAEYERCYNIRKLIMFLCNNDKDAAHWLTCWLAYPLQNLGAKMDTSVLLHSNMEGSGKSFLLSDIMRVIYGDYGATVGQDQLESSWSIWQSSKLYGVFEEVVSRDQRFNQVGKIKHMITGKTVRIESKFMNGWEEANYLNAVFLSNELMPWPISENDRRMFVIWPKQTLDAKLQKAVASEIDNQGIEAFYSLLLNYDVGDFYERTRPPLTEARQWLVEVSRTSWETFFNLWRSGDLGVPYTVVASADLYGLYREWCSNSSEHGINSTKFSLFLKKYVPKTDTRLFWYDCNQKRRQSHFFYPNPPEGAELTNPKVMGEYVKVFRNKAFEAGFKPESWAGCDGWQTPGSSFSS